MARTPISFLERRVQILAKDLGVDLYIERGNGGYRLTVGGRVDLSPRLTLKELDAWIDGFWTATYRGFK
jgi:hypothetical protein